MYKQKLTKMQRVIKVCTLFFTAIDVVSSFLTVKDSLINSYERKYGSDKTAIEDYTLGLKYINEGKVEDALGLFKNAYEINPNLFEVRYYYLLCMLAQEPTAYLDKVQTILFENEDYLIEKEYALYAYVENLLGNKDKAKNLLDNIETPETMDTSTFCIFIDLHTRYEFEENYNKGVTAIQENEMLFDIKISSLDPLRDSEITIQMGETYDVRPIVRSFAISQSEQAEQIYSARLDMYRIYFANAWNHKEFKHLPKIMKEATDCYFSNVVLSEESVHNFLDRLYNLDKLEAHFYGNGDHTNSKFFVDMHNALIKIIRRIKDDPRYVDDLTKCLNLYDNIKIKYDLQWEDNPIDIN